MVSLSTTPQNLFLSLCTVKCSLLFITNKFSVPVSSTSTYITIYPDLLLLRLSSWFCVPDTALLWFQSYLRSSSFSVKAHGFRSISTWAITPANNPLGKYLPANDPMANNPEETPPVKPFQPLSLKLKPNCKFLTQS